MKLSIITINRNNAKGLQKTLASVKAQTSTDFEHIIIDGASTDDSVNVIKTYADECSDNVRWISEPDNGIYNAMNKGIRMAKGDYIQILNSGDCLAKEDVIQRMLSELQHQNEMVKKPIAILYGNMLKQMPDRIKRDRCFNGQNPTFLGFYTGTLNHSPAYIRRDLFDQYGFYDETLKIVSDWKWYMQAIILGGEIPINTDIDVTIFDMTGISETNHDLCKQERKEVLKSMFPSTILADYERWAFPIDQMKRLQRHKWAYKLVWFLERCLFKWEKWIINKEQKYL